MKVGRYQYLIKPISVIAHLAIINCVLYVMTTETYLKFSSIVYYNISWLIITYSLNFYPTSRTETFKTNLRKLLNLYIIYGLTYFTWFTLTKTTIYSIPYQFYVFTVICVLLTLYRYFFYKLQYKYRLSGGNYVTVVIIGRDNNLKRIRKVFDTPLFGYRYHGYFDNKKSRSKTYLGETFQAYKYIIDNKIDEVYCMASSLSNSELNNFINFADNNLIKLKIIPDNKDIFTRSMTIQKYENVPVINLRTVPLDFELVKISKRLFDIIFSTFVILGLLSWLIPLLFIIIKLESPGPLFFKQQRHGYKRKAFTCYKFRTMTCSSNANSKMASKNDMRITKIGKILRKTSIDELPQFFNAFLGDMSIVGPRPHMESHTEEYELTVNKYLVRHLAKPGITGLAQIKGYRGEICKPSDIINRIRLDIMYVEKHSLSLDLKIIYSTITNVIKGEEKAY